MTETRTVRVRIEGRVQGVFYRGWAEEQARSLGLIGWVRNRRDGSVEALFSGHAERVAEMLRYAEAGPESAAVDRLEIVEEGGDVPSDFRVLPTR